jgi:hypothetical protein
VKVSLNVDHYYQFSNDFVTMVGSVVDVFGVKVILAIIAAVDICLGHFPEKELGIVGYLCRWFEVFNNEYDIMNWLNLPS